MAATVRSSSITTHEGTGTANATKPSNTASGDLLVAYQAADSGSTLAGCTAPAGWTLLGAGIDSGTNRVGTLKVWTKTAGGSEPATYAFPANDDSVVIIVAVTGQGAAAPLIAYASSTTNQATVVAPAVSPTVTGTLLLSSFNDVNGYTLTAPAGQTTLQTGTPGVQETTSLVAWEQITAAGSTGTRTAAMSGSYKWTAASVSIPAADSGSGGGGGGGGGTSGLQLGVNGWIDQATAQACGTPNLGAAVMRAEFTIDQLALATQVADYCAAAGIRLQPLIGWDDGVPAPDLTGLANWAAALGPGGTHWAGGSDAYAVTDIELGNENSMFYKSGLPGDAGYQNLATTYGQRALAAAQAINSANPAVGVLVELEGGDSNQSTWIDRALAAGGATLKGLMHGPVIHLYGPAWASKLTLNRGFLANQGVTKPYSVTEFGIATDNGRTLLGPDGSPDNYDWSTTETYAQASTDLQSVISGFAARPADVRQAMIYQVHDSQNPGAGTAFREAYFGITRIDFTDKTPLTGAMRTAFATYRGGTAAAASGAGSAVSGSRATNGGTRTTFTTPTAVSGSRSTLAALTPSGAWSGMITVAGYGWSSLTDWSTNHPSGWISDPRQNFVYEAHHYWDTASDPSLGSRSGSYQQTAPGGGVQTETYATELAAATAQIGGAAVVVSGTRAVATPASVLPAAAGAVSGTRATAVTTSDFAGMAGAAVSGTAATIASGSYETLGGATAVSGTRSGLAASVMINEPTRALSGTVVAGAPDLSSSAFGTAVSGTVAGLLEPGQIPASAGEVISGSLATVAEQRETTLAAVAAVSGTVATAAGTRQTWTDTVDRRVGTVVQGPTYFDATAGQPAATFAIQNYLGPTGSNVGRLTRTPGTDVGWGAILAANITGATIPAGTEVTVTWWARGTSQDEVWVVDDAFTSVAGQLSITGGPLDEGLWGRFTGTTTLGVNWVPGTHRVRCALGAADTDWLEWSDVLATVAASGTVTTAVSGSRVTAAPSYTQPAVAVAVSGSAVTAPVPTLTMQAVAVARSATRGELAAAWTDGTIGAQAYSGTRAVVAETLTAVAAAVVQSGTRATTSTPALTMQMVAVAVSGSRVFAAGTTEGSVAPSVAVSGTVAYGLGVQVAIGVGTARSATVVIGGLQLGTLAAPGRVVSATVALATAASPIHPVFVYPTGTPSPQVPTPRLTLLVVETTTGRKVAEWPALGLSWNAPLNDVGKCSGTAPIEAVLDSFSDQRLRDPRQAFRAILSGPYRFSLVPCYGRAALMGGPLLPSTDVTGDRVAVGAAGMERMLEKRVLNRPTGVGDLADASRDITFGPTNVQWALTRLVAEAMSTYSGRYPTRILPITMSSLPNSVGTENFSWRSYDLVTAWKAVGSLGERTDGPDFRLEPYLVDQSNGTYVYWDLQVGNPYLPVSGNVGPLGPTPWSFSVANTQLSYTIDPTGMASSYFATGEGQDRSKVIARADSGELTVLGFPTLEEVDATSNQSQVAEGGNLPVEATQDRAYALISAHRNPTSTWSLTVPVDGSPDIGLVRRGDVARIEVRDKLYLEPGYHLRRITNITGGTSRTATLECNDDDDLVGV